MKRSCKRRPLVFLLATFLISSLSGGNIVFGIQEDVQSESSSAETEDESDDLVSRVRQQLLDGNIRDARDLIRTCTESDKDVDVAQVQQAYRMVIAAFNRTRNNREVFNALRELLSFQLDSIEQGRSGALVFGTVNSLQTLALTINKVDQSRQILEETLRRLARSVDESSGVRNQLDQSAVRILYAQQLIENRSNLSAGLKILRQEMDAGKDRFEKDRKDDLLLAMYLRSLAVLLEASPDEDEQNRVYELHQRLLQERIDQQPDNISFTVQFVRALIFRSDRILDSQPRETQKLVVQGENLLNRLGEKNPDSEQTIALLKIQLTAVKRRADAQLWPNRWSVIPRLLWTWRRG